MQEGCRDVFHSAPHLLWVLKSITLIHQLRLDKRTQLAELDTVGDGVLLLPSLVEVLEHNNPTKRRKKMFASWGSHQGLEEAGQSGERVINTGVLRVPHL